MRSLPPVRNQSRIRFRYLLWRQDFILSEKCKLKTRTHMGKSAPTIQMALGSEPVEDQIPVSLVATRSSSCRRQVQVGKLAPTWENVQPTSLVATRFPSCHLVGEVQVENLLPHGKTCTHKRLSAQALLPTEPKMRFTVARSSACPSTARASREPRPIRRSTGSSPGSR